VGGVRIALREKLVESVLGFRDGPFRDRQSDATQSWGADRNEKRGNRLDAAREVIQSLADEIGPGKTAEVHRLMIAAQRRNGGLVPNVASGDLTPKT
jgi:hypothetical protein